MGAKHQIYPEQSLGIVTLQGTVTGSDVAGVITALYEDGRWQAGFSTVWDARAIEELIILPADLPGIVGASTSSQARQGNGRLAGVVRRDLDNELGQLILALRKSAERETKIFWSVKEAMTWLGISAPPPRLSANPV